MKKTIILGLFTILFILTSFIVLATSPLEETLEKNGRAKAIIILEEPKSLRTSDSITVSAKANLRAPIKKQVIEETQIDPIHNFNSFNGFSAAITKEEYYNLKQNKNVKAIQYDFPVKAFLSSALPIINTTWHIKQNNTNITGMGRSVCIIDTGINYSHPDLGGCTISNISLNGNTDAYVEQTPHPYLINTVYKYTITQPGYTKIAIHFVNISTDVHWDHIKILDANNKTVATYTGSLTNIWSPSIDGDTLHIELYSDHLDTDYGFYINETINGTTNTTYDWSSCNKILGGWDVQNSDPDPYDDEGHGTHIAGIVAAQGTIKGVAQGANIVAVKSLDQNGEGTGADTLVGIEWCIDHKDEFNISVISMSLGGGSYNTFCDNDNPGFSTVINEALKNNIAVIAATGNEWTYENISIPACIENVTRVTRTDDSDNFGSDANRGSNFPDILAAPGTSIISTCMTGDSCSKTGTSMSAPMVAGAFAVLQQFWLLQNGTEINPPTIEQTLNDTGKPIYDIQSSFSYPRINILSALYALDQEKPLINLTLNTTNITWLNRGIEINWSITDNLNLAGASIIINDPNNTQIAGSTNASSSIHLNENNLTNLGTYTVTIVATDANNNTRTSTSLFDVNAEKSNISLLLNGSNSNITINETDFVNITGFIYTGDGAIDLLIDSISINSSLTNISQIQQFNIVGIKNITLKYNYTGRYDASETELFVTVNNLEPNLDEYYPPTDVSIRKNRTQEFQINVSDDNNQTLTYEWFVNNSLNATTQNYTFNTSNYENGTYNLTLNLSNGNYETIHSWIVTILQENNYVLFNYSNNISDQAWNQGSSLNLDLSTYFFDEDNETLTYTLMNTPNIAMSVTDNIATFSSSAVYYGEETGYIIANDSESNASSNNFTITVNKVTTTNNNGGGGGGGGGREPNNNFYSTVINNVKDEIKIVNSKEKIPMTSLDIKINGEKERVRIKIIKNDKDPKEINELSSNILKHSSITVEHEGLDNSEIASAKIEFRVEKQWLLDNSLKKENVILLRYVNKWNELKTTYETFDDTYFYFTADSPGLSSFIIGAKNEEIIKEPVQERVLLETKEEQIQEPKTNKGNVVDVSEEKYEGHKVTSLQVKAFAALASTIGILLAITIIDKFAKKKAQKDTNLYADAHEKHKHTQNHKKED